MNIRVAKTIALALAAAALPLPAWAQEAAGDWVGPLQLTPEVRLPLAVHITRGEDGTLSGTMDSPRQNITGMALADVISADGTLSFSVPTIGGTYKGSWDAATSRWKGEWKQAQQTWPLELFVPPPPPPFPADWQVPDNAAIGKLIAERNTGRDGQLVAVGIADPTGDRFVAGGNGADAKVDRTTLYEIGSISKVFTALLLADMANKGEVALDDPADKYMPAGHVLPTFSGRKITLRDLSTHRSSLPRMADDLGPPDGVEDPFAGYGEDRLLAFLDRVKLTREVGSEWEYSNLGVGLLGYLLARAAHTDFDSLLRQRITGPLGMKDTVIVLDPAHAARMAPPFDRYMRPAKRWDMTLFAPAGGIRSSAADMIVFAHAVLDPASPIAAAVRTALSVRVPAQAATIEQALGWQVLKNGEREFLLHGGQTGGYQTMLAFDIAKQRAVVVLTNSQTEPAPEGFGIHLLTGNSLGPVAAVPSPPAVRNEIALPSEALDKFVGQYRMDFGGTAGIVTIARPGTTLTAQRADVPGAQAIAIYPETPTQFFWKVVDAQIRFVLDDKGAVTGAELSQGGATFKGTRLP